MTGFRKATLGKSRRPSNGRQSGLAVCRFQFDDKLSW
jgi:hypothetical protein